MKDGRTHLAHKAEHAVDLDTGAVVAVTLQGADQGDTTTLDETLCEAGMAVAEQVGREAKLRPDEAPKVNVGGIEELVADKGYHSGAVLAVTLQGADQGDTTTLEANAAMRSIVRRDTGESYEEFLRGLAKASGIATPTREDLARLDRKRKKRTSNKDWKLSLIHI